MRRFLLPLALAIAAGATTIRVPSQQPTIQAGLNAANSGDTVLVAAGNYKERLTWPSRDGIKLISESGPEATMIDGDTQGIVVTIGSAATRATLIKGFKITRGRGSGSGVAGISCSYASPSIIGNRVTRNHGIGISLNYTTNALVLGNEIDGNWVDAYSGWNYGGGMYVSGLNPSARPEICYNYIHHDTLRNGYWNYGAGLYCDANAIIYQNIFEANAALDSSRGHGAGIYINSSRSPIIFCNLFLNNRCQVVLWNYGAAIKNNGNWPIIVNNTFSGNVCTGGTWNYGGAIYNDIRCTTIVKNNIFANNQATSGSAIYNWDYSGSAGLVVSSYNDYYNNTLSGVTMGPGDITSNPLFTTGWAGNFFLSQTAAGQPLTSPCVNAGDTLLMTTPLVLDSLLRVWTTRTDTVPDQNALDMGYHYVPPQLGPAAHDVACTHIVAPLNSVDSTATTAPACSVYNCGTRSENYSIRMKVGTFYNETATISGHAPGTRRYVTFPLASDWPRGTWTVSCSTELATDTAPANNKATGSVFVLVLDAQVVRITEPSAIVDSGTIHNPSATVRNNGNTAASFPTKFRIGSYEDIQLVTSLPAGETLRVDFAAWTARPRGPVALKCSTMLEGDMAPGNDWQAETIRIAVHDIGVQQIVSPGTTMPPGNVTPQAVVHNHGTDREATDVTFTIDASPPYSSTLSLPNGLPV
ncbi:MAG: right-handed parallel beta-helix repeat-containing protein, partial [candidate division WOR-3 bacterium]